mmetsp:Transcript_37818/g.100493  ORF Transcript_37818/g.100493 Transcript_37818/m.100493 type:complete len:271 (-) Transcript_37818:4878-5690(-)
MLRGRHLHPGRDGGGAAGSKHAPVPPASALRGCLHANRHRRLPGALSAGGGLWPRGHLLRRPGAPGAQEHPPAPEPQLLRSGLPGRLRRGPSARRGCPAAERRAELLGSVGRFVAARRELRLHAQGVHVRGVHRGNGRARQAVGGSQPHHRSMGDLRLPVGDDLQCHHRAGSPQLLRGEVRVQAVRGLPGQSHPQVGLRRDRNPVPDQVTHSLEQPLPHAAGHQQPVPSLHRVPCPHLRRAVEHQRGGTHVVDRGCAAGPDDPGGGRIWQ